ncbi:Aspartyl protease [Chitinophaga sancti]|nr:Aspartyl protease [Chitinophaga sancti]
MLWLMAFVLPTFFAPTVQAQSERFEIAGIIKALNDKDDNYLMQRKADSARIGDLPYMADQAILKAVLEKYGAIQSYQLTGIDSLHGFYKLNVAVVYESGRTGKPAFVFNKNGKWVHLDILRTRKEIDPVKAQQQSLSKVAFPDTVYTKFVLNGGLIYIPARLGDVDGYFMLDSGAPMVIFNKTYVPDSKLDATHYTTMQGIGGGFGNSGMAKMPLRLSDIRIDSLEAPVAEMQDYEALLPMKVFGLLGYEFFKNYALVLNYQNEELVLIKRGKEGAELTGAGKGRSDVKSTGKGNSALVSTGKENSILTIASRKYTPLVEIPLTLQRHIAIVSLSFEGKPIPFGLDCGANANLFKTTLLPAIAAHFDPEKEEVSVSGMGHQTGKANIGYIMNAYAGNQKLDDMYTAFSDQKIGAGNGEDALKIEGLLGTPFLNLYVTEIDYINQKVILYKPIP